MEFAEGSEADSSMPKDEKSQFHLRTAAELFMYLFLHCFSLEVYPKFPTSIPYLDMDWLHFTGVMKRVSRNHCVSVLWQHVGRVSQKI